MTKYYPDERITYDEADRVVHEFVNEMCDVRTLATPKDICRAMGIDWNEHNRQRVMDAADRTLPESDQWPGKYEVKEK